MSATHDSRNPFPGLRAFAFAESDRFFGREDQIAEVLRRLRRHRFLAVIGASGSGKSSLIRAGVIPVLDQRLRTRSGSRWRIAIMTPGNAPIARLAESLAAPTALGTEAMDTAMHRGMLEATLRRGALGLIQAVRENLGDGNLLLLVDQFEELFRVTQRADAYEDPSLAFVRLLLEAGAQQEVPIYVLLTMRSDFLGDCVRFPGLPEAINRSQYLIPNLSREQRREVITGPVALRGAAITPRLVHRLLNDVGDASDQLTTLQHALMRTWDHWSAQAQPGEPLDLVHYEAIGTLSSALERHAEEALAELRDEDARRIAETVFKRLTERGADGRDVRHPTTLADLCAVTGQSREAVLAVLAVFRRPDRCFLLPGTEVELDDDGVVDIAHESLIRVWRQLREWVEAEAQSAGEYKALAERMMRFRAGLDTHLQNPALALALEWRARNRPNAAWAQRYDRRFTGTMAFLDESEAAHLQAEQAKKAAERRELEQAQALVAEQERRIRDQRRAARRLGILTLVLLIVFVAAVVAAINARSASERAAREARESMARGLALDAVQNLDQDPELSLLLGLHAVATTLEVDGTAIPVAWSALNRAVQAAESSLVLARHDRGVRALAFAGDTDHLVVVWNDDLVRIIDVTRRETLREQHLSGAGIRVLATSPDGRRIAMAGDDGLVRLWRTLDREPERLASGQGGVWSLAFSPDGRLLASGAGDGGVRLWDLESPNRTPRTLAGHVGRVSALAFRPDGAELATGGWDGTVGLWDPATGTAKAALAPDGAEISAIAYSPDGSRLAAASWDARVRLWDLEQPDAPLFLSGHEDAVLLLDFSDDGQLLATGGRDSQIRVWDTGDGKSIDVLDWHRGSLTGLRFRPGTRRLASAATDGNLAGWDPSTGDRTVVREGHDGWVTATAFSADGRRFASGGDDGRVVLWHLATNQRGLPAPPAGFDPWLHGLTVTRDGRRVAFLEDGQVRVLDPETGELKWLLHGVDPGSYRLAFDAQGRRVATAAPNHMPRVFHLDQDALIARARQLATRDLTAEECREYLQRKDCPATPFADARETPATPYPADEGQP